MISNFNETDLIIFLFSLNFVWEKEFQFSLLCKWFISTLTENYVRMRRAIRPEWARKTHMHSTASTANREQKKTQSKSCANAKSCISTSISLSCQCIQVVVVNYFYLCSSTYIHFSVLFFRVLRLSPHEVLYMCVVRVHVRVCRTKSYRADKWYNVTVLWICLRISFNSRREWSTRSTSRRFLTFIYITIHVQKGKQMCR